MRQRNLRIVAFIDTDVSILDHLTPALGVLGRRFPNGNYECDSATTGGWGGTAILSYEVLEDIVRFFTLFYTEPYLQTLRHRHSKEKFPDVKPAAHYINDMVLLEYYQAKAMPKRFQPYIHYTEWPLHNLPPAKPFVICELMELGFDKAEMQKHGCFEFDTDTGDANCNGDPVRSVHFRGNSKPVMREILGLVRNASHHEPWTTFWHIRHEPELMRPENRRGKGRG
mmetsp:Transcript_32859/g.104031  ORF Transcript_32859/g.104031 Transcript_32859/m.104031 type:complete len:226 (-) Transcript_32859:126-803(-)